MKNKLPAIKERILLFIFYVPAIIINRIHLFLFGKNNYIKNIRKGKLRFDNKNYSLFVYWQRNQPPWYVINALKSLQKQQINTILVINSHTSDQNILELSEYSHTILERENQGFDFGGYKEGITYLYNQKFDIQNLIFMNDSVYYSKRGLDETLSELINRKEDIVSCFENWEIHHHYQSFLLRINRNIFNNNKFKEYWENYIPISNRRWCIHNGEVALSKAINKIAYNSHVIFSAAALERALTESSADLCDIGRQTNFPKFLRSYIRQYDLPNIKSQTLKLKTKSKNQNNDLLLDQLYSFHKTNYIDSLIDVSHSSSPIHCSLYLYMKYMRCPIIKKDLVYRDRYNIFEIERILFEFIELESAKKITSDMRLKGSGLELRGLKRIKYNLGII